MKKKSSEAGTKYYTANNFVFRHFLLLKVYSKYGRYYNRDRKVDNSSRKRF